MPSDPRTTAALAALAAGRSRYHSALAATVDGVRAWLDGHRADASARLDRLQSEFGALAGRMFDVDRLAAVLTNGQPVDPATVAVVEGAHAVLEELAAQADDVSPVVVPAGGSLGETVGRALARIGRAMGAARTVELARQGRYRATEHQGYLDAFPFGAWSHEERRLAPPLVVRVAGPDLRPAALAEYLDGGVKLVLVVDAPATPAPLVRVITPGVFVAQAADPAVVERLAAWDGPGVVALMPDGAAAFTHDPSAGAAIGARLNVTAPPEGQALRRVGPFTVTQQRDELRQLAALAAAAAAEAPGANADQPARADADPVGRLAAFLLREADAAEAGASGRKGG